MSSQTIRLLSIRQPHADHIIFGDKWCENRTWQTRYRGPLFIHASQWDGPSDQPTPGSGVVGAIIGRTDLVDVVDLERPDSSLSSLQKTATKHGLSTKTSSMEHVCGPVCFLLTSPKALVNPIPCGDKPNIWSKEVEANLLKFGEPQITKPDKPVPQEQPTTIGVGSRVKYKRSNFYMVEINKEWLGLAKTRNGSVVHWVKESELELGWFG